MCVQYIRGIPWVHQGNTMSTLGDTMSTSGWYHEYIRGCSVHWRDTVSTSGDVQYIGGMPWVHRGDIMSTSGDVQYIGGYHDTCGWIPWVHWGMFSTSGDTMSTSVGYHEYIEDVQYIRVFNRNWKDFIKLLPHVYHDISPMCWTSPDVLIVSATFIMKFPQCTEHPSMYSWYPPDVLNTPRCTEHTLYRVKTSNEGFTALRNQCRTLVKWYSYPSLNPNLAYHWLINRFNSSLADIKENMKS